MNHFSNNHDFHTNRPDLHKHKKKRTSTLSNYIEDSNEKLSYNTLYSKL